MLYVLLGPDQLRGVACLQTYPVQMIIFLYSLDSCVLYAVFNLFTV